MSDEIVFTTVHGSRLYGLNHAQSDEDNMIVYEGKREPLHKHTGKLDVIHVGLPNLLELTYKGSLQFMEGSFSHQKVWVDTSWRPMFDSLRVPVTAVRDQYFHRIEAFIKIDTQKARQHAVRLGLTLRDLRINDGWYDPTLTHEQKVLVQTTAATTHGRALYERIRERII